MINEAAITAWRYMAPWPGSDQVEHDLVLSRAICELYKHPIIAQQLVFRGGTALHKLFFDAGRFSEDLDFVQVNAGPIGEIVNAIRECLDHWLGQPSWKQNQGRFTLNYRFKTEIEPVINRKVKIEINTREHFNVHPYSRIPFSISDNSWYQGETTVLTYSLEELLATKLRALYQRKKGRDLYDIWYVAMHQPELDADNIVNIFEHYMKFVNVSVSRAEFEKNLHGKKKDSVFNNDISPLLAVNSEKQYNVEHAYEMALKQFLPKLKGEPWQGVN